MEIINIILGYTSSTLFVYILIPLLIIAGVYFSFRTKFVQFRLLRDAFKSLTEKAENGKISSFKSLMISTASKVGVGHIAGIASAILIGGPGAVFWMWVMALLGSSSAFIESTLAQIFKVKDGNGGFRGGPSYYIEKALKQKWLGIFFACLLIAGYAYGFNSLQAFQLSAALSPYIKDYHSTWLPVAVGIALCLITALVIWGGTHRIAFISVYIVPVMAITYISISLFIMCKNIDKIPSIFGTIFKDAFNFKSFMGALFYRGPFIMGVKRGLFSNEAGMGSAPNAAATADVVHPVNQGLAQVLSVFIDTLLICSSTAFIVLLSGVNTDCGLGDVQFVQESILRQIGPIGVHIIAFSIFAFAFTSIIGNYSYAEGNIMFMSKNKAVLNIFRVTCLFAVFFGTQADAVTVWGLADTFMGIMALVNIVVIMIIGKIAVNCLNDYSRQKRLGVIPVFKAKSIGLSNTDVWK